MSGMSHLPWSSFLSFSPLFLISLLARALLDAQIPHLRSHIEQGADIPGKVAEGKQYHKAQGKYSLEGALLLKTHAAQQKLKEKEKGVDPLAG